MTVTSSTNQIAYAGDGATVTFAFPFYVLAAAHVVVKVRSSNDDITTLAGGSFTVAGAGNEAGGSVTLGTAYAAGNTILISRVVPLVQSIEYQPNSPFPAATQELGYDYGRMVDIQQQAQIDRAILVPDGDTAAAGIVLPMVAERANTLIGFDASGNLQVQPLTAGVGGGDMTAQTFVAGSDFTPGTSTALTVSRAYATVANVEVHFDGVFQGPDTYTIAGKVVAFNAAIPLGVSKVYIRGGTTLSLAFPSSGSVIDASVAAGTALYNRLAHVFDVMDPAYGAVGDGVTDDTVAIQKALTAAQAIASVGGPSGFVYAPPGKIFKTTAPLTTSMPIKVEFNSFIHYYGTSGSAFIVGEGYPLNGINTGYDLFFAGFRNIPGNTASPTKIVSGGTNGIEIRNMQFSRLRVGTIIAFTQYGLYGNSTNDHYTYQHCQDNTIELGQVAINGAGIYTNSVSSQYGAFQANRVHVQNSFGNFFNLLCDNGTGGMENNCSSTNYFSGCMDPPAPGGICLSYNSQFSNFDFDYLSGPVVFGTTSGFNRLRVSNSLGGTYTINDNGTNNWLVTCAPATLPTTATISSGNPFQNGYGVPIMVYFYASLNVPNTSVDSQVIVNVGRNSTALMEILRGSNPVGAGNAVVMPFSFMIPPFQYGLITAFGNAVLSTARIVMAG